MEKENCVAMLGGVFHMLDLTTNFGRHVDYRLHAEQIIWLTTVDSNLTPQPRPVWFLWDGETFLIFSKPNTAKLQHIARNPHVSLNLNGDSVGGDIAVITGEAHIADDVPPANEIPVYVTKYRSGFLRIGRTAEDFAKTYSVAIRVTPLKLRGH
jgi:PPOX class probable F420-dependent enzyme